MKYFVVSLFPALHFMLYRGKSVTFGTLNIDKWLPDYSCPISASSCSTAWLSRNGSGLRNNKSTCQRLPNQPTCLSFTQPAHLPILLPTSSLTYPVNHAPGHLPTIFRTNQSTNLSSYSPARLLIILSTSLPIYVSSYSQAQISIQNPPAHLLLPTIISTCNFTHHPTTYPLTHQPTYLQY